MSTMVDNRWDPILQNQQGPITSGYVSNSDIRQRERKDQIKWERQREYEDLMNKPNPPVYYKTGGAGNSLPLGSYEESRKTLDDQRQQEYNRFVTQKKDTENKRREELYRNSQQNYRPPPEPEMYDHGQIAKDLREERQKEYNDYLKQKISEEHSRIKHRHRYTPAGGLAIGQYDLQRKRLRDELSRDYKQSLLKREQEIHTRRQMPPTPPGGLNIATEQERKRVEDIKKTMYRDELLKQQKEQLYNRATQQGEVSVINRTSPTQAPPNQISPRGRPPPHPDSGRRRGPPPQNDRMQEKSRETPNYWNEGRQAPSPKSVESDSKNVKPLNVESETKTKQPMESHRPQEGDLRTGFFDDRRASPLNRDERQQDYQQFLANKQREDEMKHQRLEDQRHAPHLDLSKGDYYDAETYERKRMSLNSERKNDYQNFLSKQNSGVTSQRNGPVVNVGLPLYQEKYDDHYNNLKQKRNNEYNELLEQTSRPSYRQYTPESLQGLPIGQTRYDHQKKQQEVQRNREYNEHLAKKGEKIGMEDELLTRRDMTLKKYMEDQVRSEMHDKKTPEQGRREWIDTSGPKGIIAGVDSYNYDKRKNFAEERKKEYKDIMEKKAGVSSTKVEVEEPVQEEEPALERKPTTPINLNAVKIFPVGSGYTRRQRELQAERKKNFKDFAEKKNEIYKKQQENRESFRESLDRDLMESPPIIPIGEYDTKKRQFKQEAHQEMVNFLERQPHGNRDKEFWNKVTKPRILPMSGEYKNRKQKLNDELRKDWRDFVLKQEPPRERIKEFGTPGAVLFTGEYEKTRQKVRDERTKDYHEFIQKHGGHAPRRMPDQAPANSIGFMANLGRDGEREKLNKERQGEYRKFLDEKTKIENENVLKKIADFEEKAFGKEGMPRGRPNWVDGKVPPDSWFQQDPPPFHKSPVRDQEPPRDRPASYGRRQTPSYEEILDSKRREEASYRRFEDPEYSRGGGLGGPNDRYD
ncbi:trichohyalin-like isoform X46 [Mytilus edulis]|uniref:trichohyalin-like isoform X46 n=1 Tax=Mytilus edulis TaxID=6550 RepID=UPI0039EFF8B0